MRNDHSNSNQNNYFFFAAGLFLMTSLGAAVVAGLSDVNRFIPGFNDKDNAIDVSMIFWGLSVACFAITGYSVWRIYENKKVAAELQSFAAIEVESVEQHRVGRKNVASYGTSNDENTPVFLQEPKASSCCLETGWVVLGGLSSVIGISVFLHIARHIGQHDHGFSNATLTNALIGLSSGTIFAAMFTGVLLFFCSRHYSNKDAISKKFTDIFSCGGRKREAESEAFLSDDHYTLEL